MSGFTISYDDLIECVETSEKKRFSFDDSGDLVRANQGHSVEVDLQLEVETAARGTFHGTVERFLEPIMAEGLKKGKRHHVHLSSDIETAKKVGARRGKPVNPSSSSRRMWARTIPPPATSVVGDAFSPMV
ncbi:hypothetical protein BH11PLA2_BH11PLA2_14470 [soil metagenome]